MIITTRTPTPLSVTDKYLGIVEPGDNVAKALRDLNAGESQFAIHPIGDPT